MGRFLFLPEIFTTGVAETTKIAELTEDGKTIVYKNKGNQSCTSFAGDLKVTFEIDEDYGMKLEKSKMNWL